MTRFPKSAFLNLLFACMLGALAAIVPPGYSVAVAWLCSGIFYVYFYASIRRPLKIAGKNFTYVKIDTLFLALPHLIYSLPDQVDTLQSGGALGGGKHFPDNYFVEYADTAL